MLAMDEAVQRKRRVDAGERLSRDSVEWWRRYSVDNPKLVVHPTEKGWDRMMPYPYPEPPERRTPPRLSPTPTTKSSPEEESSVSTVRVKRRLSTCIIRTFLWLLLISLVVVNLLELVIILFFVINRED